MANCVLFVVGWRWRVVDRLQANTQRTTDNMSPAICRNRYNLRIRHLRFGLEEELSADFADDADLRTAADAALGVRQWHDRSRPAGFQAVTIGPHRESTLAPFAPLGALPPTPAASPRREDGAGPLTPTGGVKGRRIPAVVGARPLTSLRP